MIMKRGFTLVELLATIFILGLLIIIAVPKVNTLISNSKKNVCDSILTSIEDAAEGYVYKNTSEVDSAITSNGYFEITLLTLQEEDLLEVDLENPYTNENIDNTNVVKITKNGNKYEYTYMGDDCK